MQEICDLRIEDVRLDYPASVKILGKGRKTRVVPILPATAQNLKKYLTEMHMLAPEKSHLPLFMNRNGQKLTRAGAVSYTHLVRISVLPQYGHGGNFCVSIFRTSCSTNITTRSGKKVVSEPTKCFRSVRQRPPAVP